MTLGFSTKWPAHMGALANQPNYFIEKIWETLFNAVDINSAEHTVLTQNYNSFLKLYEKKFGAMLNDYLDNGKLHTIRAGERWKAGNKIHPVINNRTKDRFQFAPTMVCTAVQKIEIKWINGFFWLYIDGKLSTEFSEAKKLAINDGFDSIEDFFAYFNKDFKGQIIHWTDLRY